MRYVSLVSLVLAVIAMDVPAAPLSPGPQTFTLRETAGKGGPRLATVSFPFAPGEAPALAAAEVTGKGGSLPAQVRVLTRHRDGSVRRALVRFLWSPAAGAAETFTLKVQKTAPAAAPFGPRAASDNPQFGRGPRTVRVAGRALEILRNGKVETRAIFRGLEFPQRFVGPHVTVVEDGPVFTWATLAYYGGAWNVYVDVQADVTGQVRLTARLRRMSGGTVPVPQFGLTLGGLPTPFAAGEAQALPFSAEVARGPRSLRFGSGAEATVVTLPDGPQIRQGRLDAVAAEGGATVTLVRDTALDATVADEHKQFYEGQERAVEVLLPPPGREALTCTATVPAARRSAALMGEPLNDYGRLQRLRELNTEQVLKLVCRDGDQYGDVTSSVNRHTPQWSITGLTRIDTGLYMIEDYYHGGDARLRDLAVGWAENWVTLKQYRGWDMNSFGGERYTMAAWNTIPSFNQKGIMMIAYAYEETGDPRYRESVLAFGDRIVEQLKTRLFVAGTVTAPTAIGSDANIRPGYLGKDLVLLYGWTGDRKYLEAAKRIFVGLATLRDPRWLKGADAEAGTPFGAGGYGLLREGYGDPYSLFERFVTGTDLGVTEDNSDHLKPYILEYLLEGSQYVYGETKDPVAQATMVSLSDFMVEAREAGSFWNYAQRHAAEGNNLQHMTIEIANGLLKSYSLTGDKRYKDAAFEALHLVCKAFDTYGSILEGVVPPSDRHYFYPGDHCDLDFYRGSVGLENTGRDGSAYLFCALDRMLRIDPQAASFLLSPPTHPRHRWLLEQAPLGGLQIMHEIGSNYIARIDFGRDGDQESGGKSDLVLLEDGKPLGPPHSLHQQIRDLGAGRYSHWTRGSLYFSTSDSSNPLTNGRRYTWYYGSPEQVPPADQQQALPTREGPYADRKPHPSVALYERGLQAEREKRYTDAIAVWEEVLKQWPDSAPELYRQIALWQAAGNPEQAAATCRRFIAAFPKHDRAPEVHLRLVSYLLQAGQQAEAATLLEELARSAVGTPWGEEAAARLWRELGRGPAPATVIHAVPGQTPQPQTLTALQAADGLVSPLGPQVGAAYDENNLYLRLKLPVGAAWPAADAQESFRLFVDPEGSMTSYQVYVVDSQGNTQERPAMWHNRLQGYVPGAGWQAKTTREADGWTAELTIPFSKLGFRPEPGRHTWRLGYRWESLGGVRLWRPSLTWYTRPQDCGWLVFD